MPISDTKRQTQFQMWGKITSADSISPKDTASELLKGRPVSSVDASHYPALVKALGDIKNRAIVKGDKPMQRRVDRILDEISKRQRVPGKRTPMKRAKQVPEPARNRDEVNAAVDELLDGNDIEEVDPSVVPELRAALKQRQTEAIKRFDYDSAKAISGHLDRIHQLVENQKNTQPARISRQKEETLIAGIKARQKILRKLQESYEVEVSELYAKREEAKAQAEREYHKEMEALMAERERVNDGVDFKVSGDLASLRKQEEALATSRNYEEATKLHETADDMERRERIEYDQRMGLILMRKQQRIESQRTSKLRTIDEFWDGKKMKIRARYREDVNVYSREIEAMRARLARFGVFVRESDASVTFEDQNAVEMPPEDETVSEFCERLEKVASQGRYDLRELSPNRPKAQRNPSRTYRGIMSSINLLAKETQKTKARGDAKKSEIVKGAAIHDME